MIAYIAKIQNSKLANTLFNTMDMTILGQVTKLSLLMFSFCRVVSNK